MLAAKKKAARKPPAKLSNSKFLEKVWCEAHYNSELGTDYRCTCGMHDNYIIGYYCEDCGGYHDYDY